MNEILKSNSLSNPRLPRWAWMLLLGLAFNAIAASLVYAAITARRAQINTDFSKLEAIASDSETKNWQTYRNEEYGFEVKYPPSYTANVVRDSGAIAAFLEETQVNEDYALNAKLGIFLLGTSSSWPETMWESYVDQIQKESNFKIDSIKAFLAASEDNGRKWLRGYHLAHGDSAFGISMECSYLPESGLFLSETDKVRCSRVFSEILSTFKFIDSQPELKLGQEFTLYKADSAIVDDGFKITVTDFIYSPCPQGAVCVWSGLGINFEYAYKGETKSGMNLAQAFGYQIEVVNTDYKTFATLVVSKLTQ